MHGLCEAQVAGMLRHGTGTVARAILAQHMIGAVTQIHGAEPFWQGTETFWQDTVHDAQAFHGNGGEGNWGNSVIWG